MVHTGQPNSEPSLRTSEQGQGPAMGFQGPETTACRQRPPGWDEIYRSGTELRAIARGRLRGWGPNGLYKDYAWGGKWGGQREANRSGAEVQTIRKRES